ncbi:MAG: SAM-dependent methyltransferase [Candidatus Improbicoccus pseudotrichonymphae]|uniref:SAM-dependent methyltransferase n=1 Tax=Candidatus Improbicoccus pseudotrichonymphae TaxID=3033792 RepID=A0AA48I2P8_9FIRM|nr:MAG: SAM-dependent methyltransferase [Candidatus Improbicoccus pseudotrichonymphae]
MRKDRIFYLSERLYCCTKFINSDHIADVGTDHAKLPIWLVLNSKIKSAIASDINVCSVEKARRNIKKYNLENSIEPLLSDGFENIDEDKVDEVVISGLGGNTISEILGKCSWKNKKSKRFILQPCTHHYNLRKFLVNNGYKILKEEALIENNKAYSVFLTIFEEINEKYDDLYFFLGEVLNSSNNFYSKYYLEYQIKEIKKKINGCRVKSNIKNLIFYENILRKLENKRMII